MHYRRELNILSFLFITAIVTTGCNKTLFRGSDTSVRNPEKAADFTSSNNPSLSPQEQDRFYDKEGNLIDPLNPPLAEIFNEKGEKIDPNNIPVGVVIYDKDGKVMDTDNIPLAEIYDKDKKLISVEFFKKIQEAIIAQRAGGNSAGNSSIYDIYKHILEGKEKVDDKGYLISSGDHSSAGGSAGGGFNAGTGSSGGGSSGSEGSVLSWKDSLIWGEGNNSQEGTDKSPSLPIAEIFPDLKKIIGGTFNGSQEGGEDSPPDSNEGGDSGGSNGGNISDGNGGGDLSGGSGGADKGEFNWFDKNTKAIIVKDSSGGEYVVPVNPAPENFPYQVEGYGVGKGSDSFNIIPHKEQHTVIFEDKDEGDFVVPAIPIKEYPDPSIRGGGDNNEYGEFRDVDPSNNVVIIVGRDGGRYTVPVIPIGELFPSTISGGGSGGSSGGYELKPDEKWMKLIVIRKNHEAWWKNCVRVWVPETKYVLPIGCNKDISTPTEYLIPVKIAGCNHIELVVWVFFNKEDKCQAGVPCNGPYYETPDFVKTSFNPSNYSVSHDRIEYRRDSFMVFNVKDIPDALSKEGYRYLLHKLTLEPDGYGNPLSLRPVSGKKHVRVFFEDQPYYKGSTSHLRSALYPNKLDTSSMSKKGIDYNDYVLDFIGENFEFKIIQNGSNPYAGVNNPGYLSDSCSKL